MATLRIGSLFSGIGGLDLAVEAATGGRTVWQVEADAYCRSVLARHWPDAERFDDVRTAADLPAIDVLAGGFPCQDLSDASQTKTGLAGKRSGLFFELVRIAAETRPAKIIIENVSPLLKWRGVVEAELAAIGYRCRWARLYASSAGAPHLRRRVFIVATPDQGFELAAPMMDLSRTARPVWPTATAINRNEDEDLGAWQARRDKAKAESDAGNGFGVPLGIAVRLWPTPSARCYRSGSGSGPDSHPGKRGSADLPELLGGRLTPAWVAQLMGLVDGWIEPAGAPLSGFADRWPAGPDAEQFDWEAPRLMTGAAVRGRPARLKALGNAVVPQQALLALNYLL